MKIPGLGCLKGLPVHDRHPDRGELADLGADPAQDWIGTGKGYWDQLTDWAGKVGGWIEGLGGSSGSGN